MRFCDWRRWKGRVAVRPIEKGAAPREYEDYRDAIGDLEARLGTYCSYCERRLPSGLAVEHKAPKGIHCDRELDWDNFLLSCPTCNSVKGKKDLSDQDTLWPDSHNTLLAVSYAKGGLVEVAGSLHGHLRRRAKALVQLVGLDRHEAAGFPSPTGRDDRWRQREQIWSTAESCRDRYESLGRTETALGLVLDAARGYGFPSVWLTVFAGHPPVKLRLIDAFPGTPRTCFDARGEPVARTALGI